MSYFLCRLNAPRPTFPADMTQAEAALMQRHADWWTDLTAKGTGILFGPVLDPKGVWGLGLIEVEDQADARALTESDPIIQAGLGFSYEISPIQIAAIRGSSG
jgi:uncharacterized protein YciI